MSKILSALGAILVLFTHGTGLSLTIKPIPEEVCPTHKSEFDERFLSKNGIGQPVVFRKFAKDWPAVKKWSPDYFATTYPDYAVSIQVSEKLTTEFGAVETKYEESTLSAYIGNFDKDASEIGYLAQQSLASEFPVLLDALKYPDFFDSRFLTVTNLWMGPKGTKSKLHFDSDQNLFVQIFGKKIVRLVSPVHSENCYPINKSWYDAYSPIDVENPDLTQYPKFDDVEIFEAILEPGDMLYIPRGWWHDIRSLTPSISANLWWISWSDFSTELKGEIYQRLWLFQHVSSDNSYVNHFWNNIKKEYFADREPG